ncbi:MAG: enoyl-CoA hydratase/isomerase family protein [Elusimicrobia bacterium]|nr:enoyl-CoA hydratase/isomerase family protein [Elusimicrobiota bacterium]
MPRVLWSVDGPVGRLTLNRPEALNALDEETAAEFSAAVRAAARSAAKVVVLEGAGRAFCAGGDLHFIERNQRRTAADLAPRMRRFYGAFLSVRALPQIVVAKVQGAAFGAGLCLALAADLRVAAEDARLSFNFVRLGLNPGMAAWPLARAAFGDARARELLVTGRTFSGRELAAWGGGFAAAPDALLAESEALARRAAVGCGAALRLLKAETRLQENLAPFLTFEARGQARAFRGPDLAEGLAAARERREPLFRG